MSMHIVLTAVVCLASAPCAPLEVRVWDGDTAWFGKIKVRMVGYDAPEHAGKSRCRAERKLADRSRMRLSELLSAAGEVRVEPTGGTSYDRTLARLFVDGVDVGAILVEEGLATRERHDRADWC